MNLNSLMDKVKKGLDLLIQIMDKATALIKQLLMALKVLKSLEPEDKKEEKE